MSENIRATKNGLEHLIDGQWVPWLSRRRAAVTTPTLSDLPSMKGCDGEGRGGVKVAGGPDDPVVRHGQDWLAVRTLVDPPVDEQAGESRADTDGFNKSMRIA